MLVAASIIGAACGEPAPDPTAANDVTITATNDAGTVADAGTSTDAAIADDAGSAPSTLALPALIDLPYAAPHSTTELTVRIANPGDTDATALSATLIGSRAITFELASKTIPAHGDTTLVLRYAAAANTSLDRAILSLSSSAGGGDIPIYAVTGSLPAAHWEDVHAEGGILAGRGTTLALPHAPYASDASVRIFVPEGYRDRGAHDLILHFHGWSTTLADTLSANLYQEHVYASGTNAILVVPQGPVNAQSGNFGKLMDPDQTALLFDEVLAVLYRDAIITRPVLGGIVLTSHSGGYQATAMNLRGSLPIRQVDLFDSLYGYESIFEDFVADGGRLRSNYTSGGGTLDHNQAAAAELRRRGISVATAATERALLSSIAVISFADTSHYGSIRLRNAYGDALRFGGTASSRHGPRIDLRTAIAGDDGTATVSWLSPADEDLVGFDIELELDGVWSIAAEVGPTEDRAKFPFHGGANVRVRPRMRGIAGADTLASDVFRIDEGARVLVVDHFERVLGGGFSGLAQDFAAQIGEAAGGASTIGSRAITEDQFDLAAWDAVIWSLGDQSTEDQTFTPEERAAIQRYLANGGHLVVSGSELGYDLAAEGTAPAFLTGTLGARYLADASGRDDVQGVGPLASVPSFHFGGAGAPYAIDYPDVLGAVAGGAVVLQYGNGRGAAAGLAGHTAVTGFPLESIDTAEHRAAVTRALLMFAGH